MSKQKDIDEVLIEKVNNLIKYIHVNTDRDALKKTRIVCLAEIPELLVSFFELVIDEHIPDDQKPFRTFDERRTTLQIIIDTLEQNLTLPLSHINGRDVAKLDRRQLGDIIQIFSDLITQLFPPRDPGYRSPNLCHPSVFENDAVDHHETNVQTNRPLTVDQLHTSLNTVFHQGCKLANSNLEQISSLHRSNLSNASSRKGPSSGDAVEFQEPDSRTSRCLSPIAPSVPLPRKPSVYPLSRKQSVGASSRYKENPAEKPAPAKPLIVPVRRLSTKTTTFRGSASRSSPSPLEKSGQKTLSRKPSTKSLNSVPKVVKFSNTGVRNKLRKASNTTYPTAKALTVHTPKRRRPSVISSKVRKHSVGNQEADSFKYRTFSPRTITLASSIKLLQEFDYAIKRLKEIEKEMETHIEALRSLQEEKVRLVAVMDHIKKVSNRGTQQVTVR